MFFLHHHIISEFLYFIKIKLVSEIQNFSVFMTNLFIFIKNFSNKIYFIT
jgi:hypothetical protein